MNDKKIISWIDTLRALAIIAVVTVHVSIPVIIKYLTINHMYWWVGNIFDSCSRFCVPVFAMITGALLLPRPFDLKTYFNKRISRVLIPFIIWTVIYIIYNALMDIKDHNPVNAGWFYNQLLTGGCYHLWYIYMLLGLYLLIPIFSRWVQNCSENEIILFLVIWLCTFFLDSSFKLYQIKIDLHNFSGFVGYMVLGYYLSQKTFSIKRLNLTAWLLIITGCVITAFGSFYILMRYNNFSEDFYNFFTLNVLMASIGVFIVVKNNHFFERGMPGQIKFFLSKNSYGIYLAHMLILELFDHILVRIHSINPIILIPVEIILCLAITGLILRFLSRLPLGKYITG